MASPVHTRVALCVFLASCWLPACFSQATKDALVRDSSVAPVEEQYVVLLRFKEAVTLAFGETRRVGVEVLDIRTSSPLANIEVQFALDGVAHDSSLSTATTVSDEDGIAWTVLQAGRSAAAFRIRARATQAQSAYVGAAVGSRGFGVLEVIPEYTQTRMPREWRVGAIPNVLCRDARSRDLVWRGPLGPARIEPLPAATQYAVVAEGLAAGGNVVAAGCVENVRIEAMRTTTITLTMADTRAIPDGQFESVTLVDSTAIAQQESTRVRDSLNTDFEMRGGLANLIVARIQGALLERGQTGLADMVASQRASLIAQLGSLSAPPDAMPWVSSVARVVHARLAFVSVRTRTRFVGGDATTATILSIQLGETALEPSLSDAHPRDAGLADALPTVDGGALVEAGTRDAGTTNTYVLTGPQLTVAFDAFTNAPTQLVYVVSYSLPVVRNDAVAVAVSSVATDPSVRAARASVCGAYANAMSPLMGGQISAACDRACVSQACGRVLDSVEERLRARFARNGGAPGGEGIDLSGALEPRDADGDGVVERLRGILRGRWRAASDVAMVSAEYDGAR